MSPFPVSHENAPPPTGSVVVQRLWWLLSETRPHVAAEAMPPSGCFWPRAEPSKDAMLRETCSWETQHSCEGRLWLDNSHTALPGRLGCFYLCFLWGQTCLVVWELSQPIQLPTPPPMFLHRGMSSNNVLAHHPISASASQKTQANTSWVCVCLLPFSYLQPPGWQLRSHQWDDSVFYSPAQFLPSVPLQAWIDLALTLIHMHGSCKSVVSGCPFRLLGFQGFSCLPYLHCWSTFTDHLEVLLSLCCGDPRSGPYLQQELLSALTDGKTKQNYACYHFWFEMVAFWEVSNQKLSENRVLFASKP